jgi:hypothetical protein
MLDKSYEKQLSHSTLYPERSQYEIVLSIALEATRKRRGKLNPDITNPVLERMKKELDSFSIEEGSLKIRADNVDDFNWEEDRVRGRVLFSYSGKFNATDLGPGANERFNNYTRDRLRRGLLELSVEGDKGVVVSVTEVKFPGELKSAENWPREKWNFQSY